MGYRLKGENGHKLETLCAIKTNPRKISNTHLQLLENPLDIANREGDKAIHPTSKIQEQPINRDSSMQDLSITT